MKPPISAVPIMTWKSSITTDWLLGCIPTSPPLSEDTQMFWCIGFWLPRLMSNLCPST